VEISQPTISRIRQQFVEAGLIALTSSKPPAGQARWSLRLLADKLVELAIVEAVSHQTVRRVLKKTNSSRG
jgi:hypothetical protein